MAALNDNISHHEADFNHVKSTSEKHNDLEAGAIVTKLDKFERAAGSFDATDSVDEEIDPDLVTWDGPEDPGNPKNWSTGLKNTITVIISLGDLVALMSGSMMAPALGPISDSLHATPTEIQIALSIYILAWAFSGLVVAPCSEVFGRKPVWIISSIWYVIWNLICGFATSKAVLIAARFMTGCGASAALVMTTPILSDCWNADQRGKAYAVSSFIPLLGTAIGPILGGVISQRISWRWLFWVLSILDTALIILVAIVYPESYGPTLLARKAKRLRVTTGRNYYSEAEKTKISLPNRLKLSLKRPYRLMITQPVLQLLSLFSALSFGVLYMVLSTFATLWIDQYHQSEQRSSLNYIALVIGYTIAGQLGGRALDVLWKYLERKHDGLTCPEYRLPLLIPAIILVPAGLFLYGWSGEERLHWIVTDIGATLFGCGYILSLVSLQAYLIECFNEYTASASAASSLLRSILAFVFPIFAPSMYDRLGYGWGNSLMAFLYLAIGLPLPLILWKYGARLRARAKVHI